MVMPSSESKLAATNIKSSIQQANENPFKENISQTNLNYNGGPLYGVSERDHWLLARDEEVDEVHISKPKEF